MISNVQVFLFYDMTDLDGHDLSKSVGTFFLIACVRRLMYWLKESLKDLNHEPFSKKRANDQLDPAIIKLCTVTEIVRKLADCPKARAGKPSMVRPRLIDESTADPEYRS